MRPPAGRAQLRLLRSRAVRRLARTIQPDVIIERYHNFGGEGALAAKAIGARFALEVNAPVIDYPGSPKAALDRALIAQPMRRWRDWQVSQADLIVTPSAKILPDGVPADRVLEIEWGADTTRFHPGATGAVPWTRDPSTIVAVFAGAFRAWHGAIQLVEAVKRLHALGHTQYQAVLIGEGPERGAAEQAARGVRGITFAGRVAHTDMPSALAAADIGVAPFDVSQHPPLALAFYWSPLKVFEYMASGLPVVAPGLPRLRGLVEHGVRRGALRAGHAGRSGRGHGHPCRSSDPRADGPGRARPGRARLQMGRALPRARRRPPGADITAAGRAPAHRDRFVSSQLRRQRLEHVRAGPRAPRARTRGRHRAPAARRSRVGRRGVRRVHGPRARRDRARHSVRAQLLQERTALGAGRARPCTAPRVRTATISSTRSTCSPPCPRFVPDAGAACPSSPPCATTGRSATGRISSSIPDPMRCAPSARHRT